jgi:hypothetical protein
MQTKCTENRKTRATNADSRNIHKKRTKNFKNNSKQRTIMNYSRDETSTAKSTAAHVKDQ